MSKLWEKLIQYKNGPQKPYPFHMPGHKRQVLQRISPYEIDITEIEGFDNLHFPEGIIKEAMDRVSDFYETKESFFLINGSTVGILAAISGTIPRGGKILVGRNCHKSVYNSIYLNELDVVYLSPEVVEGKKIPGGISWEKIDEILEKDKEIEAVVITSPTYEGIVSNIEKISEVVHCHGKILIVDEAHGAHFGFHPYFPKSAVKQGADIVIQSLHKTLPALTQTALLHVVSDRVESSRVKRYLSMFQTSSPSYVLMESIDYCMDLIMEKDSRLFDNYAKRLLEFREKMKELKYFTLLNHKDLKSDKNYDYDNSKLVFFTKGSGKKLVRVLEERYGLIFEMAGVDFALGMTSCMDTEEGFSRLEKAMFEMDEELFFSQKFSQEFSQELQLEELLHFEKEVPKSKYKIYEAMNQKLDTIKLFQSEGRVAGDFITPYPPGIPLIVPGEIITKSFIEKINFMIDSGIEVHGVNEKERSIKVINKSEE